MPLVRGFKGYPIHRDRIGASAERAGDGAVTGAPRVGSAAIAAASSFSRSPMATRPCRAAVAYANAGAA